MLENEEGFCKNGTFQKGETFWRVCFFFGKVRNCQDRSEDFFSICLLEFFTSDICVIYIQLAGYHIYKNYKRKFAGWRKLC